VAGKKVKGKKGRGEDVEGGRTKRINLDRGGRHQNNLFDQQRKKKEKRDSRCKPPNNGVNHSAQGPEQKASTAKKQTNMREKERRR